MEIIQKSKRVSFSNSDTCVAYEYSSVDNDINGALIFLKGRYPDKGWAANRVSKELAYITEGSIKLITPDSEHTLAAGDLVIIDKGEKFAWSGQGEFLTVCTPAWHPNQHSLTD